MLLHRIVSACLLLHHTRLCKAFSSEGILRSQSRLQRQLMLSPAEMDIGICMAAFSASHIGMSAIREDLIDLCGVKADERGLVNRPGWKFPDVWPGDEAGLAIWPTQKVAGRQIYRMLYTLISFLTLGSAFSSYLDFLEAHRPHSQVLQQGAPDSIFLVVASLSWGVSISSLFNASPLSLVPSYETNEGQSSPTNLVVRDDSRKLKPKGLTRISRHPLILPVLPWGLATAGSMGGNGGDFLFFGSLSAYAVVGCLAQDLRVSRKEGSVGTVFTPEESLQDFFEATSFLPFGAVLDGRQSISDIIKEVPWLALLLGIALGYEVQTQLIHWLSNPAT